MNVKSFTIGTLVGGIVFFLLGFLVYALLLEGFYEANQGSAQGVMKTDDMDMVTLILGNLAYAALLTYIFLQWAHIKTFGSGFKAGFIIGLLMGLGYNLISYGTTNLMNLTGALVDVIVFGILIGITGGVIGLVLGRVK